MAQENLSFPAMQTECWKSQVQNRLLSISTDSHTRISFSLFCHLHLFNGNAACRAYLCTFCTAHTFLCVHNCVTAFPHRYCIQRTFPDAHATGNTDVFICHCHSLFHNNSPVFHSVNISGFIISCMTKNQIQYNTTKAYIMKKSQSYDWDFFGGPSQTRTVDRPVMSRML